MHLNDVLLLLNSFNESMLYLNYFSNELYSFRYSYESFKYKIIQWIYNSDHDQGIHETFQSEINLKTLIAWPDNIQLQLNV